MTRIVMQGAGAKPAMPPCAVCGEPKVDQQRLTIAADGRLIHAACKEGKTDG